MTREEVDNLQKGQTIYWSRILEYPMFISEVKMLHVLINDDKCIIGSEATKTKDSRGTGKQCVVSKTQHERIFTNFIEAKQLCDLYDEKFSEQRKAMKRKEEENKIDGLE